LGKEEEGTTRLREKRGERNDGSAYQTSLLGNAGGSSKRVNSNKQPREKGYQKNQPGAKEEHRSGLDSK